MTPTYLYFLFLFLCRVSKQAHKGPVNGIVYSFGGKVIVTSGDDNAVNFWYTSDLNMVSEFITNAHATAIGSCLTSNNNILVVGDSIGTIQMLELKSS